MRRLGLAALVLALLGVLVAPSEAATNDPLRSKQWGLDQVRAERAWASSRGAGVTIAIVDSGIDLDHPDLVGKTVPGITYVGCGDAGCGNGDWQSGGSQPHPHGTHVAGIAGAATGNGVGIAGVAPDAKLMAVKVLDAGQGSFADIGRGIRYAADNGAQVINLSIGLGRRDDVLRLTGVPEDAARAIEYAHSRGVVVVASAGNNTFALCTEPAITPGVVCVAATDRTETHSFYSNFPASASSQFVAVSAPGGAGAVFCEDDVLSTVPPGTQDPVCRTPSGYDYYAGTSMAAPHVSGVAALLAG
jgi:subtilisin family serine protease